MCDLNGHLIFAIPNAQVPFSFLIPFSLSRSVFLFRITYAYLFLVGSPLRFLFNSNSKHERSHTHNPTCFLIVRSPTNLSSVDPSKLWLFNLAILFSHEQLHSIDASLWLLLLFQCVCVCAFFPSFREFFLFSERREKNHEEKKIKRNVWGLFLEAMFASMISSTTTKSQNPVRLYYSCVLVFIVVVVGCRVELKLFVAYDAYRMPFG